MAIVAAVICRSKGGKLLAIEALLPYYAGQLKCIYIDPPYAVEADFCIKDFSFFWSRFDTIPLMKSRQRIIDYGEVFTPPKLVSDMLDLVAHECERIDSRFLEPACGNGNFLAEVLRRKLLTVDAQHSKNVTNWERAAVLAVCSLYGIDLLSDNVVLCRDRLLNVVAHAYNARYQTTLPDNLHSALAFILSRNVVQGDALTFRAADGRAIVLSEWSPLNGALLKRRDFSYEHLIEETRVSSLPLFNELGEDVFVPMPVGNYPPCHYLKVPEAEATIERP